MQDHVVSIIVPVYNAEEFLDECIQHVIRQTYTNWELILVDDGATDRSPEICDGYARGLSPMDTARRAMAAGSIAVESAETISPLMSLSAIEAKMR